MEFKANKDIWKIEELIKRIEKEFLQKGITLEEGIKRLNNPCINNQSNITKQFLKAE